MREILEEYSTAIAYVVVGVLAFAGTLIGVFVHRKKKAERINEQTQKNKSGDNIGRDQINNNYYGNTTPSVPNQPALTELTDKEKEFLKAASDGDGSIRFESYYDDALKNQNLSFGRTSRFLRDAREVAEAQNAIGGLLSKRLIKQISSTGTSKTYQLTYAGYQQADNI